MSLDQYKAELRRCLKDSERRFEIYRRLFFFFTFVVRNEERRYLLSQAMLTESLLQEECKRRIHLFNRTAVLRPYLRYTNAGWRVDYCDVSDWKVGDVIVTRL